jgi:hypothetical protein
MVSINGRRIGPMTAFLKRVRWAVLRRCDVLVIRLCRLFHIRLSNDSLWSPHKLVRFRPHQVLPRVIVEVQPMAR